MAEAGDKTTSYKGAYGEVVYEKRPPHRQFPQQAWGLQTGCWSSFGEYFPASGGVVVGGKDPTSEPGGEYIPPRNKAESGIKKNLTSVVFGSDLVTMKSSYQMDVSDPRRDADGNVTLDWANPKSSQS